ncbi:MAG: hypothetical protein A3C43_00025 [Candidatus Schekmanbacteria bacterium RIFCSPHIGHO2_02_FULL_38_11]|uniref:Photosynthesis system II assembly factor Ycf48/Hcf136-like domain-containing protein n=1 Tax=Candidatus Schekmanbacteria bacterium RIFCSPLOWO2_12_FULL_38_15 TaxID=1817883 RepID=A0A1F7SCZ4_9BACT|nr:MAG: hypothetical protein A3G31_05930 [Candidatus Schekmanbacteria bacterium RIFCSPLOWO2_12_FULL_38_15]OGL53120.1 MAG: hypothetical protein A3C43_00025 [Candidatus Schekmanbacteria bacterium RIFCSPHIGHO2_02_FULL_38_11]
MIKNVSAINFITGEKGFIVDSADKIWRTSDGGKTWSLSYELPTKGTDNYIRYITMINQETAYVLGSTILKTNNGGNTWFKIPFPHGFDNKNVTSIGILFLNTKPSIYIGTSNLIYISSNDGNRWDKIIWPFEKEYVTSLYATASSLMGGTSEGYIFASDIKGLSWKKVGENKSEGIVVNGKKISSAPKGSWGIIDLKIFPSGVGYSVNIAGGVSKTEDHGKTWKIIRCPDFQHDMIHMSSLIFNEKRVFIPYFGGDILYTHDGGKGWNRATVKLLNGEVSHEDFWSISMIDENKGWLPGFFGRFYKTEDGGKTWKQQTYRVIYK